jgi:signal transduction histidine kinase
VNILLVDDQPAKLLAYEAMLGDLGENLIKANSGEEALEHLLRTEITVVLMDVSMPGLDGFELAQIIRGHPRYQKTAIIFVSAVHFTDVDQIRGYASGAVDYVSVPVIPEVLRAKVTVFTELYRKSRALERLTRDLESRVAERTAALESAVARQRELMEQLRKTDRRKDEFLALLGHELRNPLAPMRNALEIMRARATSDPEIGWCHSVIERQTNQLARLVDDLLDVARISQGKIKLRVESVDLRETVTNAIEATRPAIEAKKHTLTVSLPEAPLRINGDPVRLTQLVSNLLNNAAKYQDDGGHIDVVVRKEAGNAEIRVKDRGIGVAPAMRDEVFELFAQADHARGRVQDGLGIGLSLVKNLVEMHGGNVELISEGSGHGSEFVVRIPNERDAPVPEAPAPVAAATTGTATKRRILVVDDNEDAATSMAMLLRLRGHDVTVVHDGLTAVAAATEHRPDVLLLDIGLPDLDGYQVCQQVRAHGLTDTQIIAITGYGQERDQIRAREAGFDSHTVKPVAIKDLLALLEKGPRARAAATT